MTLVWCTSHFLPGLRPCETLKLTVTASEEVDHHMMFLGPKRAERCRKTTHLEPKRWAAFFSWSMSDIIKKPCLRTCNVDFHVRCAEPFCDATSNFGPLFPRNGLVNIEGIYPTVGDISKYINQYVSIFYPLVRCKWYHVISQWNILHFSHA